MNTTVTRERKTGHLQERAVTELKEYFVVFVFLALMYGAFTLYRRLIMNEVGISYAHWGSGLIQAAVIAKVILLGQAMSLGRRIEHRPLIVSVLIKALLYSILVAAFNVLERIIEGLLHGDGWQVIAHRLIVNGPDEILARAVMVFVVFIPFFALWETRRVLGPGKLAEIFFHERLA